MTYAYNGDGLRVWQDDGVDEVRYVHDGNNVLLEMDGVGTVEAEFTYIPQAYRCPCKYPVSLNLSIQRAQ